MKKVLSLVLVLSIVLGSFGFAFAAPATEAQAGDVLKALGVLQGTNAAGDLNLAGELNRQDMIVLLSRLLGEEDTAKSFGLKPSFTDVTTAFYVPYIAWAEANGYTNGIGGGKFGFGDALTVQQTLTFLMRALGYTPEWADVPALAVELELVANTNGMNATATRGKMASLTLQALFTPMNGEEVTLGTFLGYEGFELEEEEPVVEEPTDLELVSVNANNRKEVDVVFSVNVDKTTAENTDAYSVKQGISTLPISSANVLEDGKTVRLTLTGLFTNQVEAELAVTGVKAAEGAQVLTVSGNKFTPVDVTAPVIEKVESLGNKAIKITFSEPVVMNSTVAGTFKINDLVVSGVPTISGRTVTIQLFSTLPSADHVLSINNQIADHAGIQLVATNINFTVVVDNTPPTVAEIQNATLEGLTVVFSEDVQDTEAMLATNYFWMQGTTKKNASSVEKINGKTFRVNFTANNLPGYATELTVQNVKDYSGNVIAAGTKVTVHASLDQSRPEVLTAIFDSAAKNKMTLTFTKNIDAASFKASNVVIKRANGTVAANGYSATVSGKVVVVNFANAITVANTYTFEISGLTDTTLLKNSMLPYSTEFTVKNTTAPVAGANVTGTLPNYIITFSKTMDTTTSYSILNPANYYVTYNTLTVTGITGNLPAGTNIVPTADSKGVIITFPAGVTGVTKLVVQGVKDTDDNFLSGYAKEYTIGDFVSSLQALEAKATGKKTIMVKMNQPVGTVSTAGFTVSGNTVTNAVVDSADNTLVKLTLANAIAADAAGVTVTANASAATQGITGATLIGSSALAVADAIAPSVVTNVAGEIVMGVGVAGISISGDSATALTNITITFDEAVKAKNQALVNQNFLLFRNDGIQLVYGIDYVISAPLTNSATVQLNITASGTNKIAGYAGSVEVVFDNSNENIVDVTVDTFVTSTAIVTNANGFDTRSDDTTGMIAVDYTVAAPVAGDVVIAAGTSGKTDITIANTLEFRITDANGVQKQAWTTGTGSAITSTPNMVAGDKIEVRVKATGLYGASPVYTHVVLAAEIG